MIINKFLIVCILFLSFGQCLANCKYEFSSDQNILKDLARRSRQLDLNHESPALLLDLKYLINNKKELTIRNLQTFKRALISLDRHYSWAKRILNDSRSDYSLPIEKKVFASLDDIKELERKLELLSNP